LIGLRQFDLVWVLHLDPKRMGPLRFENIMFSHLTQSGGVNVLEDLNLEVEVGENVAVVYVIFGTSKTKLLIVILA
jgi:ABC-type bacteriocin/lantibiotic exporter with double-glycine peptidase domain